MNLQDLHIAHPTIILDSKDIGICHHLDTNMNGHLLTNDVHSISFDSNLIMDSMHHISLSTDGGCL